MSTLHLSNHNRTLSKPPISIIWSCYVHPFTTTTTTTTKFPISDPTPEDICQTPRHPLMANTPFLLESNFNFNPLLQQTFHLPPLRFPPIKLPSGYNNASKLNNSSYKVIRGSQNFRIKCFFMSHKPKVEKGISGNGSGKDNDLEAVSVGSGINEVFWSSIKNVLKALQKPVITGVLLGLLLFYDHHHALAASGGRMGGRSFSSSSSSSSSRSFSTRTRGPELSFSAPYYAPTPFGGGGFFVGPAVGFGSSFFFVMMGFAAFILVSGFLSDRSDSDDGSLLTATEKTSVLKLQVGLLGMGRSLQRDLNRIAEAADTSSPEGLSYVLQETTLALLRHPDYCISGYSSVDVKRSVDEGEKRFNQLSIEERGKFDEETLVNVNNIRKQSATTQRSNGFRNEYIVITIIVAASGVHKLPPINSSAQLKEALQKLASIPSSRVMAVEVLWTPQNENDTLTERELLEDYSLLRPL